MSQNNRKILSVTHFQNRVFIPRVYVFIQQLAEVVFGELISVWQSGEM